MGHTQIAGGFIRPALAYTGRLFKDEASSGLAVTPDCCPRRNQEARWWGGGGAGKQRKPPVLTSGVPTLLCSHFAISGRNQAAAPCEINTSEGSLLPSE